MVEAGKQMLGPAEQLRKLYANWHPSLSVATMTRVQVALRDR